MPAGETSQCPVCLLQSRSRNPPSPRAAKPPGLWRDKAGCKVTLVRRSVGPTGAGTKAEAAKPAPHADFADKSKEPFRTRATREPDFCGSESGGRKRSGSGGRGASRVAVGKRFRRFVPGEQRASRRLCRTLGLPDFGKSSTIRGVCRVTSRTVRLLPHPPGGRVRRRVVGGSLPVARIENRSRVACPLPGPVVGRRGKSEKSKLAVSLEPRANRRTGARVKQTRLTYARPGTSRRWRVARNVRKNRAAGGVTVLAPPGSSLSLLAPTHGATRAVLLLLAAGRGSEQGAALGRAAHARHAGRVPALPASAWPLPPFAPPERRGEAGCPSPVDTVEAADAARFVPPVFSSSFSGARAKSCPASGAAACPYFP